jgi:hypothetical protein
VTDHSYGLKIAGGMSMAEAAAQREAIKGVNARHGGRYQKRKFKSRRADDATRLVLAGLSRFLAWRQLLVIVKAETLIRWHRKGFRLFWQWKSRAPRRPAISVEAQRLIATMASANRTWGQERIANELLLKLGI